MGISAKLTSYELWATQQLWEGCSGTDNDVSGDSMMDDEFFSTEFSDRIAIAVPWQVSRMSLYSNQDHTYMKGK